MKFDATAIWGLIPSEKSEPPACRWLLILGDEEKAMKFVPEAETEVFQNGYGGVSVSQPCEVSGESYCVYFGSTARTRDIANAMLKLADEIDAMNREED